MTSSYCLKEFAGSWILSHHPDMQVWRGRKKCAQPSPADTDVQVPTVRVMLVQSLQVPPQQSALVQVRVDSSNVRHSAFYIEPDSQLKNTGLVLEDALLQSNSDGFAMMISNP